MNTENIKTPEVPVKPVFTEEEKRAKRNAYSRAYYASHKDKMIESVRKCQAKNAVKKPRKVAKHAMKKPVQKKAIKPVKSDKNVAKLENVLEKAQIAYEKALANVVAAKNYATTAKAFVLELKAKLKDAKRKA